MGQVGLWRLASTHGRLRQLQNRFEAVKPSEGAREPVHGGETASRETAPEGVLEALISGAQESGRLTVEDVTVALEELELDAGQLDEFHSRLEELQIEVVDREQEDEEPQTETASGKCRPRRCSSSSRTSARSSCSPRRRRSSSRSGSSAATTARSRRWSRPTCASSSRSRSGTATRAFRSSTSSRRGRSASFGRRRSSITEGASSSPRMRRGGSARRSPGPWRTRRGRSGCRSTSSRS